MKASMNFSAVAFGFGEDILQVVSAMRLGFTWVRFIMWSKRSIRRFSTWMSPLCLKEESCHLSKMVTAAGNKTTPDISVPEISWMILLLTLLNVFRKGIVEGGGALPLPWCTEPSSPSAGAIARHTKLSVDEFALWWSDLIQFWLCTKSGIHARVLCSLPGSLSSLDLAVARFAEAETWACQKSASMSRPVPFHTFPSLGPCPCPVFFAAKDFIRITKAPGVIGHGGVEDVHRDQMEHLISLGQKYLQQAFRHNKAEKRIGCTELACLLYLSKQSMMALAELTGKDSLAREFRTICSLFRSVNFYLLQILRCTPQAMWPVIMVKSSWHCDQFVSVKVCWVNSGTGPCSAFVEWHVRCDNYCWSIRGSSECRDVTADVRWVSICQHIPFIAL